MRKKNGGQDLCISVYAQPAPGDLGGHNSIAVIR